MGDMAEFFNDLRKYRKAKRASNTVSSTAILCKHGITFQSNNGGAHLVLQHVTGLIDYWPSTGLWMLRGNPKRFRGIRTLLRFYGK